MPTCQAAQDNGATAERMTPGKSAAVLRIKRLPRNETGRDSLGACGTGLAIVGAMENANPTKPKNMITDDQRKAYAELIKNAERRFESDFDDGIRQLKNDFPPKLEARSLNGLRRLGYHVDDGIIAIEYDSNDGLRREIEEMRRSALQERAARMAKFRKAVFDVWSAYDVDQAKKIVAEALSE